MSEGNIIGADSINKQPPLEQCKVEKEFFFCIFFDGTKNKLNTQQDIAKRERSGGNTATSTWRQKDTNVAGLSLLVDDKTIYADYKIKYYKHFYIEGPGTTYDGDKKEKGSFEEFKSLPSKIVGQAIGTWSQGVIAKVARGVSEVHTFLSGKNLTMEERQKTKLHFCVYGFSRGATCARLFSYLVVRDRNQTIPVEECFKKFLAQNHFSNNRLTFLDSFKKENRIVEFLGIYDTVSSIGIIDEVGITNIKLFQNSTIFHNLNARDYGLYSPQMANVNRTFHICALDEFRKNYALTDVGKTVPPKCIELFVPGCHSDIGGGYEDNLDDTVCIKYSNAFGITKMATKDPRYPQKGTCPINKQNLVALGWAFEKKWYEEIWDKAEDIYYMQWYNYTISFSRTISRGISNITLVMMWKRTHLDVNKIWGCDVFNDYADLDEFYIPSDLLPYAKKWRNVQDLKIGNRYWIIPGMSLDSQDYQYLRRKYIHFSASDRVLKSIINEPSWKDNILSRIIYHGDGNDCGFHYMQDYA